MKIVRLSWRPRPHIDELVARLDDTAKASYGALASAIAGDFWGTSNAWEHAFAAAGYDCELFIVNVKELQDAWRDLGNQQAQEKFVESVVRVEKS